jgi:hypothetical protein
LTPIRKVLAGVVSAILFVAGVWVFAPRLAVTVSEAPDFSAGSFGAFQIENRSAYPLWNVSAAIGLCEIAFNPTTSEVPKDVSERDCGEHYQTRLHFTKWEYAKVEPDSPVTMSADDLFRGKSIGFANISVVVGYHPWFIPWEMHYEKRFKSKTLVDGRGIWYQLSD